MKPRRHARVRRGSETPGARRTPLAWYKWFPGDHLRLLRGWPLIARAVCRELFDAQWGLGVLPTRPQQLREIVGATVGEWRIAWSFCARSSARRRRAAATRTWSSSGPFSSRSSSTGAAARRRRIAGVRAAADGRPAPARRRPMTSRRRPRRRSATLSERSANAQPAGARIETGTGPVQTPHSETELRDVPLVVKTQGRRGG